MKVGTEFIILDRPNKKYKVLSTKIEKGIEKLIKASKEFKEYQSIGNGAKLNCAIEEAEKLVKNLHIPDVRHSLPDGWWYFDENGSSAFVKGNKF